MKERKRHNYLYERNIKKKTLHKLIGRWEGSRWAHSTNSKKNTIQH